MRKTTLVPVPAPKLMEVPGEVAAEVTALSVGSDGSTSAAGGRREVEDGVAKEPLPSLP